MRPNVTRAAALTAAVLTMLFAGSAPDLSARPVRRSFSEGGTQAQDLAGKMSGTWVFNRELSSGFGAPGRGRGGPRPGALFAATAMAAPAAQRGSGSGFGNEAGDLTPEQRAEQAAMRQLQQIDVRITIKAAADSVTFVDTRGEHTYAVNDKTATTFIASSPVKVKVKWDKQTLKQEFSNTQAKLVQTWSVDGSDRLVMVAKVESMSLQTPERRAVFDRQQ